MTVTSSMPRGRKAAVVVNIGIWVLALIFWPATALIALAIGWQTMSPGVLSMHDANATGLVGFIILMPLAFVTTVATLGTLHIRSLTDTSAGLRVAYGAGYAVAIIASAPVVFLATQLFSFFFIAAFFEGLFR
jgi:hypothetical protein